MSTRIVPPRSRSVRPSAAYSRRALSPPRRQHARDSHSIPVQLPRSRDPGGDEEQ